MDALLPPGVTAPFSADEEAFDIAVRTGQPTVGGVLTGKAVSRPVVRVRVPVTRDGVVRYVLSAPVRPEIFEDLLRAQHLPANWVVALADAKGNLIARIPPPPKGRTTISESFKSAVSRTPDGWYHGFTLEQLC